MGDSDGLNKDQRTRKKLNECKEEVGKCVAVVLGDKSYKKANWEKRTELVRNMTKQLKDPHYVLKLLRSMVSKKENKSSSLDVKNAESALQELQLFFQQSKNIVLNQDCANEIEGLQMTVQETKESAQFMGEDLKQVEASSDQKHQPIWEAKVYSNAANELQRVVDSCMNMAAFNILNQNCANQVQGHHVVEIEGGQLRLNFPQNSIQVNQKGKNAEVHNQEMIVQEKKGNEVILTLQQVEGRLTELKLEMEITNQDMKHLPTENCGSSLDLEILSKYLMDMEDVTVVKATNLDEGTSNATTNEVNVKLSPDETRIVRGYNNANVLDEIFQEHPNIAKNFRVAEVYQKIINDIESMELMIRDMEHNGLQLTWLDKMLKEIREGLKLEQENSKLQENIDMSKAKQKENEKRLNELKKKRRLK